ncbi:MAG TPA: gas vesicle protein [Streptomyces sp.]|nr:gas vesicle protein [Streptomyces sp.]
MTEYGASRYVTDEYAAYSGPRDDDRPISGRQVALIDLLDRLLSGGVVLTGDVVLSIADIDLVRISLRAVVVALREQMEEQWSPVPPARMSPEPGGDDDRMSPEPGGDDDDEYDADDADDRGGDDDEPL